MFVNDLDVVEFHLKVFYLIILIVHIHQLFLKDEILNV